MKRNPIDERRRGFLKIGSVAVASVAIATHAAMTMAQDKKGAPAKAGSEPRLDEKDPTAQSLGYKHEAAQVDKAKFKQYAAGQTCANCLLYQAKPTDAWGPCPIFTGKQVSAKGWCSAYAKKA